MRKLRLFFADRLRQLIVAAVAAGACGWLLMYRLGDLTPGLGAGEQAAHSPAANLHLIWQDPLLLPLQLLRLLVSLAPLHGALAARLPSVILGAMTVAMFTAMARVWYGTRTTYFAAALLASAPWFLHLARTASAAIVYPWAVLLLLLFYSHWQRSERAFWLWLSPLLCGLLLYVPGMIWFVIIGIIWQWPSYQAAWQALGKPGRLLGIALWPLSLGWLGFSLWRTPRLLLDWSGLPAHWLAPLAILRRFATTWVHIAVRGPQPAQQGIGYLPLVNVLVVTMAVAGAYFYLTHWRSPRSRLLAATLLLGTALVAIGGPVSSSLLLPLIFLLAAAGIAYLLHDWLKVFPKNPLARTVGYGLLSLTVAFAVFYNLRQYFVAWPLDPATRSAFSRRV